MQDPMNRSLGYVRAVLGADRHVAELARARDRGEFVDREGEDVGRRILVAMFAVELADAVLIDQLHRQVSLAHSGCLQRGGDGGAKVGGNVGQLEAHERGVGPWSASPSCCPAPSASEAATIRGTSLWRTTAPSPSTGDGGCLSP